MIGELITTAYTYDQGRVLLNTAFSGTAYFNNISGTTMSADTIYSGTTDLYEIFLTVNDGDTITRIQPGLNTYTGGTEDNPTINISAATLNYLSAITISATTFYSGSTDLGDLFASTISKTFVDAGYTGVGTATWDYSNGLNSQITLTADTTLTITNASEGDYGTLIATQDTTGGWDLILGGGDTHKVVTGGGGILALTSAANAEDIVSFVKRGASTFYWNAGYNYTS